MAAFDVPWVDPMSSSSNDLNHGVAAQPEPSSEPPTYAAFSPANLGHATMSSQRTTILVHQKSPLLIATPPQVTRALAYSYPFIVPLNRFAGLLTWTSGDPWESFLLVAGFWAATLYADAITRWAGPIVVVVGLILGMYTRRYSSLSSTKWTGEKGQVDNKPAGSEDSTRHHKSLDEIVDELKLFTSRCNIIMDPALRMTDFLSTQRTATSATTRPALTALFIRILLVSPVWLLLTLPPLYIITTQRVVLTMGTISLTWHSRPARVSRTILWRSRTIRRACSAISGLELVDLGDPKGPLLPPRNKNANETAAALAAKRHASSTGIRFTFTIYENQRRWLGIGWTSSMLAYERASWTDEEMNPTSSKDDFQLPDVEGGLARWRWLPGSKWQVDGTSGDGDDEDKGWIYYDNKWRNGRREKDGWGRYTRRRKWCRDAELIEVSSSTEVTPPATPKPTNVDVENNNDASGTSNGKLPGINDDAVSVASTANGSTAKKRRWFRRSSGATSMTTASVGSADLGSGASTRSDQREDDREQDVHSPLHHRERDSDWGFGDDARMNLG